MKKNKARWSVPGSYYDPEDKLVNGEEFDPKMVGAYYGSSLEYNYVSTPQYLNAGDLVAPANDEVKRLFKPKRPFGTFGALVKDSEESQYRFESTRTIIELTSVEEIETVSDAISLTSKLIGLEDKLKYRLTDGVTIGYKEAVQLQASFKEHNLAIQTQIEELIKEKGYQPLFLNNKWVSKKYPDYLLAEIAELASKKKAVTGFNMKIQVVGKHTIAKGGNYVKSSISQDELDSLRKKCLYREKAMYSQGTVRVGTLTIPIQTVEQLKVVKEFLSSLTRINMKDWPERVRLSQVHLIKATI
jgi:hypothetical protein